VLSHKEPKLSGESKPEKTSPTGKQAMTTFRERLPQRGEFLYVFGGVVFFVFSWAIRGFLYQLSSLLLYHTVGEILAVFSYLMAFALVESLIVMSGLLMVSFLLPARWFREGFVYKGFIAVLVTRLAMILLNSYLFSLNHAMPPMSVIYLSAGMTLVFLLALIWVFQSAPRLQRVLLELQERMQIFIYLYLPLGFIGLVVIVLRNLR
jgi:hypothetical protein